MKVTFDVRYLLIALVAMSTLLVGANMMAPSGQTTVNNNSTCIVQQWNSQSAFGATIDGNGNIVHLAVPPGMTGVHGNVQANDAWASFVAYCPNVPDIPLVAAHLIGPPSGDFVVTVTGDASNLKVTAWEIAGWYKWKTPLNSK